MPTADLRPERYDYKIARGDDFADVITIQEGGVAVDVSSRTYTAQVRRTSEGPVVAAMSVNMAEAASGEVGIAIANTVTAGMSGDYVYDFQQSTGGVIRTLMAGKFVVARDVTRAS